MKKKFLGRVLTMLLVASMVFTLLPAPAIAAGKLVVEQRRVHGGSRSHRHHHRG